MQKREDIFCMEYSVGGPTRCTALAVRDAARNQVSMAAFEQARVYVC